MYVHKKHTPDFRVRSPSPSVSTRLVPRHTPALEITTMFATSAKTSSFVAGAAAMKTTARKTGATTKRYETRDATTTSDATKSDEERRTDAS